MNINERLKSLRELMEQKGLDAYLIISTDPHQGEYLPDHWKRCAFVSGFKGTYCYITITQKEAMVWTDGKEELKIKKELAGTDYEYYVKDFVTTDLALEINWLSQRLPNNGVLGLDPQTVTASQMASLNETLKNKGINVSYTDPNLVDLIWNDRPQMPNEPVVIRDKKYEPVSVAEKIQKLRQLMKEKDVQVHVVSNLESIARLLNVRGSDIPYNPLVISYLVVTMDNVYWFVNKNKVQNDFNDATVLNYNEFAPKLKEITAQRTVLIDADEVSQWIINNIDPSAKVIKEASPLAAFKAIKTPKEIDHMINANIKDSISLINTIYWVKNTVGKQKINEWDISNKLTEFKQKEHGFIDLSFENIASYGKNAAIIHYSPQKNTYAVIQKKGLLLLDTGGHYLDGTTDVTRTISVGPVTKEMKKKYTMVLKGHLSLANVKFPKGTRGYHLDPMARRPIWDQGLNFYHGTGHGVGYCTCVHETSGIGISMLRPAILDEGMVLTNEPGYYKEGHYGIRIENCIYVVKNVALSKINGKNIVLEFKDLTMCPYEKDLIDKSALNEQEIGWINKYHSLVYKTLKSRVKDKKILTWLKKACAAI